MQRLSSRVTLLLFGTSLYFTLTFKLSYSENDLQYLQVTSQLSPLRTASSFRVHIASCNPRLLYTMHAYSNIKQDRRRRRSIQVTRGFWIKTVMRKFNECIPSHRPIVPSATSSRCSYRVFASNNASFVRGRRDY